MRARSTRSARPPERHFRLNPLVRRWLAADDLDSDPDDEDPAALEDWDRWLLAHMVGATVDVGGVLVDRAVLRQRFACVSERCAPRPEPRTWHSCCANARVGLTRAEVQRLDAHAAELSAYLHPREPRLQEWLWPQPDRDHAFYLNDDGDSLCRPLGRCVFSRLDSQGRIRCRLWDYARARDLERSRVQPITCRIFPLMLMKLDDGTPVLGVLTRRNHRHVGGSPPSAYPCLSDPALPSLVDSMAADLDWLFGEGFASALRQRAPAAS
jgi:hypothetical protein